MSEFIKKDQDEVTPHDIKLLNIIWLNYCWFNKYYIENNHLTGELIPSEILSDQLETAVLAHLQCGQQLDISLLTSA